MPNTDTTALLELYDRASGWTILKVQGAGGKMASQTPCDGWDVRTLLNHMLEAQRYFAGAASGEDVPPPSPSPSALLGDDPVPMFEESRSDLLEAFGRPGVLDKRGTTLGIAFADQLLHGWDVAKATGQDTTMPAGLPAVAYDMTHGRFTEEQRKGVFKPEVAVPADASPQDSSSPTRAAIHPPDGVPRYPTRKAAACMTHVAEAREFFAVAA